MRNAKCEMRNAKINEGIIYTYNLTIMSITIKEMNGRLISLIVRQ